MDIPEEIEISLVRADEYPAVAALRWEWESEGGVKPFGDPDTFAKEFAEWALRNADTYRCIVVRRNGTVIGMAWLVVVARVPVPGNMSRAGGDLQSMYVSAQAQGRGFGSRLLAAVFDEARRLDLKKVVVQATSGSMAFYGRNGFSDAPKILQAKLRAKL